MSDITIEWQYRLLAGPGSKVAEIPWRHGEAVVKGVELLEADQAYPFLAEHVGRQIVESILVASGADEIDQKTHAPKRYKVTITVDEA